MENQHRQITGYRELSQHEIDHERGQGEGVRGRRSDRQVEDDLSLDRPDPRWMAIAQTHLQEGFMAMTRAIAKPGSF